MDEKAIKPDRLLQPVGRIRIVLPFALFIIVVIYEAWEGWALEGGFIFDLHLVSEGIVVGVLGPTAVFLVLSYIITLLQRQVAAAQELENLNHSLEQKVGERTQALAARNEELAAANTKLQKLDQLKSDFISLISHELRTPLTTMNGGLEMALQQIGQLSAPHLQRTIEVVAGESNRLAQMVEVILDISQLNAGRLPLHLGPVAINPLLRQAAEQIFSGESRLIIWHTPPQLPPLWVDETYVEEIVRNLLGNARKYTPPDTPVVISAKQNEVGLEISITDHGPGIPEPQQAYIFDKFFRHGERDRIANPGWGLGLYFARLLTEIQGGTLTVTSPVHDTISAPGTRFTLTLPVTAELPQDSY